MQLKVVPGVSIYIGRRRKPPPGPQTEGLPVACPERSTTDAHLVRMAQLCHEITQHLTAGQAVCLYGPAAPAYATAFLIHYCMTHDEAWAFLVGKHRFPPPPPHTWRALRRFQDRAIPRGGVTHFRPPVFRAASSKKQAPTPLCPRVLPSVPRSRSKTNNGSRLGNRRSPTIRVSKVARPPARGPSLLISANSAFVPPRVVARSPPALPASETTSPTSPGCKPVPSAPPSTPELSSPSSSEVSSGSTCCLSGSVVGGELKVTDPLTGSAQIAKP